MADGAHTQTKDTQPPKQTEKELLEAMSVEERVFYHYQHGQGSIQDIARTYRMTVDEVLHIIGQDEMREVHASHGDLIDQTEAGATPIDSQPAVHPVQFDTA